MIRSVRGVKDILPDQTPAWRKVEATAHALAIRYGFQEIRIPLFEQTELFARSIGTATDIVEKEMYTFLDRDGTSLSLRPEGTAGVVRAYLEHNFSSRSPVTKLYYLGPMFRYERPQAGRFRQFHQFGVEAFGTDDPLMDVEVISLLWRFFHTLGISGLTLIINSLGTIAERQAYSEALRQSLSARHADLCHNCQRRLVSNPLRILDCKVETCTHITRQAPVITDFLSPDSSSHFRKVQDGLDLLEIPYVPNPYLVRGLDYYTRTTFEITASSLGAQNAIGAGGRYDGLVELLGGPPTPAVGFAAGLERILLLLPPESIPAPAPLVFVAAFGEKGRIAGFQLLEKLRIHGFTADTDYRAASLKALLRSAHRRSATYTIIIGDDEASAHSVILRNMAEKTQEYLPISSLIDRLRNLVELSRF
ncbi:MAG: histidine--tRNA ligase [Nitrospirae bacterium]|nr:MAG: histidine--tRNA ligase [Nitrospirota bacterium]